MTTAKPINSSLALSRELRRVLKEGGITGQISVYLKPAQWRKIVRGHKRWEFGQMPYSNVIDIAGVAWVLEEDASAETDRDDPFFLGSEGYAAGTRDVDQEDDR